MSNSIFWIISISLGLFIQLSIAALSDFDILVFSQQWPRTTCIQSRKPPNQCNVPRNNDWTIHGIWPSKSLQIGPRNCRRDLPFKVQELSSIRNQLQIKWINVLSTNSEGFWKHEWDSHGTCSVDMPQLNTQLKYFQKGLELNNRYKIGNILSQARITPGRNYAIRDILQAFTSALRASTQVTCIKDTANKQFLHEVRICFNKNLQLISCSGHIKSITNCDSRSNIEYPKP